MGHVSADKVAGCQGGAETELTGKDGGGHDACETAGVVSWVGWVCTTDSEQVEHGSLSLEDGAAADGTDFYGWHGDADV